MVFKHTKIGATVGPSCQDAVILEKMVKAGMNFARLNFAHGTHDSNGTLLKTVRAVEQKTGEPLAVLIDLQGPRIRIGNMPESGLSIVVGQSLIFNTHRTEFDGTDIPVDHPELHKFIKTNDRMLIDDGHIEIIIEKVEKSRLFGKVVEGALIKSHKGINLPDSKLKIPALSEKDRADLSFGVKSGVDMVGLSFVSSAKDIAETRKLIDQIARKEKIKLDHPIFIIAKIERHEAVDNIDEIIDAADGIMVARGDLGLELKASEVPVLQKTIIAKANAKAKPVIVATQMLASMQDSRRATRAEISDVANAVIDHADALLLTNETASGHFPVEAVTTMAETIIATEKSKYDDVALLQIKKKGTNYDEAIAQATKLLGEETKAVAVLVASITGETGRLISHVRSAVPTLVGTTSQTVARQLNLSWGVKSFLLPLCNSLAELTAELLNFARASRAGKKGDKVILVLGEHVGITGEISTVTVKTL